MDIIPITQRPKSQNNLQNVLAENVYFSISHNGDPQQPTQYAIQKLIPLEKQDIKMRKYKSIIMNDVIAT